MTLITTWYVLSVTMKEIDSNLPNEILKSVRDIEIEKFIEEEGDALRSQLCLWHIENKKGHHGNFGSAYQCLDCMKEIEKGRCEVDIENFDIDMFYYFRSFWQKVDIKGEDECWPWLGAIRKDKYQTVAYINSPFHKSKTHSAARVAFWLSRGYTGTLRITHKEGCDYTCCNPLHLRIMGVKLENPKKIGEINLQLRKGKTIYDHARNNREKSDM